MTAALPTCRLLVEVFTQWLKLGSVGRLWQDSSCTWPEQGEGETQHQIADHMLSHNSASSTPQHMCSACIASPAALPHLGTRQRKWRQGRATQHPAAAHAAWLPAAVPGAG